MNNYQVKEDDTRTYEQRHDSLPVVREEEYPEWEAWWNRTWINQEKKHSYKNSYKKS